MSTYYEKDYSIVEQGIQLLQGIPFGISNGKIQI
jgi:hypothetical protein